MKFFYVLLSIISANLYGQVSIRNQTPEATLHIDPSSKTNPTGSDGILVPRVNNFPQDNPEQLGQLLFLQNNPNNLPNHFYYWNDTEWISFPSSVIKEIDQTVYSFDGTGFTGTGLTRNINFTRFVKKETDNFSILNNQIIVGKKGTYAIAFTGSVKRPSATLEIQSNFDYSIYVNGVRVSSTHSSISAETVASTSVSYTFIQNLNVGDKITCSVTKSNEGGTNFQSYGINNLTLYFLKS